MNGDPATNIGGPQGRFPTTIWSQLLQGEELAARQGALEALARTYWKPVYVYIRSRWLKSNEDAKELTQDFFAWMIETDFVAKADPRRGRFRPFVKAALEHFLLNRNRDQRRQKRGAGGRVLSLDWSEGEQARLQVPDRPGRAPEEVLALAWRAEILTRASKLLRDAYAAEGKEVCFLVFQEYYLSGKTVYSAVAAKYGISEVDVSNYLMRVRDRFQRIVRNLVAETVAGREELEEEMTQLFGGTLA